MKRNYLEKIIYGLIILVLITFTFIIFFEFVRSLKETYGIALLGFLGSILGGVIGGIFTYLGVKITIDKQRENEIPLKLIAINNANNLIRRYMDKISDAVNVPDIVPGSSKAYEKFKLIHPLTEEFEQLKTAVSNEVANVNGFTYKRVLDHLVIITLDSIHGLEFRLEQYCSIQTEENINSLDNKLRAIYEDLNKILILLYNESHALEKKFK